MSCVVTLSIFSQSRTLRTLSIDGHSSACLKWVAYHGLDLKVPLWHLQKSRNIVNATIWEEHRENMIKAVVESKINEILIRCSKGCYKCSSKSLLHTGSCEIPKRPPNKL
ncbi:hypothetical protein RclHR1_06140016 [Rhizophagus clarus]|uniref:Uncharacterized protein n=1 Tax=Rhizophagus clarus TaxID=94130 RepID=A0A2Z6RRJ6_9GLOM|nr:hypothetical protein RclHR1_06140016 [Rhizophagus clarus]